MMDDDSIATCLATSLFDSGLVSAIGEWRKARNLLIHDVAIEELSIQQLTDLAKEGEELFLTYERVLMDELAVRHNFGKKSTLDNK